MGATLAVLEEEETPVQVYELSVIGFACIITACPAQVDGSLTVITGFEFTVTVAIALLPLHPLASVAETV